MSVSDAVAIIVSGLVLGSLYALMASGLSLVWGTLRMFNFAHGTLMMVAAYTCWHVTSDLGGSGQALLVGSACGVLAGALAAVLIERLLVQPFLKRPAADLVVIITTLGGMQILQNGAQLIWGPRLKKLPELKQGTVEVFGTAVDWHQVVIMVLAPLLLVALVVFLRHTKVGLSIRAVEQNHDVAQLVGVDVERAYRLTFAVSGGLAALAGVLLGAIVFITPTFGTDPLLKAFIVVVFGGLGSLMGTVVGAYVIGLVEALSVFYIGLYYTPVVLFVLIIVLMFVRPSGLMGRPV